MEFLPPFLEILQTLSRHKVDFIVVGGYAVIYHGYSRTTADLDIWIGPSNQNKEKLLTALEEYGIEVEQLQQLQELDFSKATAFFIGSPPNSIDFLTRINGVSFDEALAKVNFYLHEQAKIPILQYQHLILSKISNDRLKDKADVEMLQKIRAKREK